VLKDASVIVQSGDRVALVGANGAGKSTLLRILMGEESVDSGDVSIAKGTTIGYVSQFVHADCDDTVFEYVAATFEEIFRLESRLRQLELDMAKPEIYEDARKFAEISAAYDRLQKEFTDKDGYATESRIRKVLAGLNFPSEMHGMKVQSLSGGQKTRLSLARLLAWQPDILVLDEPTNYLDTDTLTWLEDFLQTYSGSILMVSHDRYFLDKVATVIYELDAGTTTRYVGNYTAFVEEKAARFESDLKRYEAQQKEIARMETFIQKNIARSTTTKRAQSRRKMLERMVRLEKPSTQTPKMALRFTCKRTSGKDVLRISNLVIGYPDKVLAGPIDLYVPRGERIAIIGPNGIGKTTFLKAIAGRNEPLRGEIQWGTHTDIGYYDQEQSDLDEHKTVLSQIHDEFPMLNLTTVRTALGRFLFRGEDVNKPVAALSGGERSRLALCRLMLTESNVLILDEPTNHLDLLAKEVLEDALEEYEGTLIFVSHDRYFIDALATTVLVMSENGLKSYIGNYSDYLRKRADEEKWDAADESSVGTGAKSGATAAGGAKSSSAQHPSQTLGTETTNSGPTGSLGPSSTAAPSTPSSGGRRVVRSADLRKLRDKVAQIEAQIEANETRQSEIHQLLCDATVTQDVAKTIELNQELESLMKLHETLLSEWENVAAELEALESQMQ
jgi:ATP-binding cassette subfamily F protein 3